MTAPRALPPLAAARCNPLWFADNDRCTPGDQTLAPNCFVIDPTHRVAAPILS